MRVHSPPPPTRRRLRRGRVLLFLSGVLLCLVYALTLKDGPSAQRASEQTHDGDADVLEVHAREVTASNGTMAAVALPLVIVNRTDIEQCVYVDPQPAKPPTPPPPSTTPAATTPGRKGDYPEDLFSVEERRQGWVALHVLGMTYMFVALAIVCDEFFVPALEVITVKLDISDDVAGATFMAAGGSAPELFTSLIGVFVSHSNVGIGTIVGSAVFNILFVIGMCAIASREMLHLTWWPLFRDVSFYILDLAMLIVFFLDNVILWWESVMLVMGYISYVSFMKFNSHIERAVKSQLNKHMSIVKVSSGEEPEKESDAAAAPPPPPAAAAAAAPALKAEDKSKAEPEAPPISPQKNKPPVDAREAKLKVQPTLQRGGSSGALQRGGSTASLHNTSLRSTIFQLMIHTLDPMGEEAALGGEATKASSPRKSKREGDHKPKTEPAAVAAAAAPPGGAAAAEPSTSQPPKTEETTAKAATAKATTAKTTATPKTTPKTTPKATPDTKSKAAAASAGSARDASSDEGSSESDGDGDGSEEDDDDDEENEPLSLQWPETKRKQLTYLFLLPIVLPLWLTLPDVRNPASRNFFAMTFIGSILWIGIFSYMMVWWAHQVGETVGISEEIMGLTILAAGTSIPDLITSVIVARKGLGDMAVSSSVGSNIFDITIGLPVPWLIYSGLHGGKPVAVSSNGLFCAIVLLFLMLLFVIISIAACRWKMSRKLGLTMFVLYLVFLVLSVLLEDRVLTCPVSI